MSLFHVSSKNISNGIAKLSEAESHHLIHVLRKKIGDSLTLVDGEGLFLKGKIISIDKEVEIEILETEKKEETAPHLILCQAVLKNPRMDWLIEKVTELGITAFIPFISKRTVLKFDSPKEQSKKIERWERIANAAIKQSQRGIIPQIGPFLTLKDLLQKQKNQNALKLLFEFSKTNSYEKLSLLMANPTKYQFCIIMIGPEGGLTEEEIKMASEEGFHLISLGKSILRAETAALKTISILNFLKEENSPSP